MGLFRNGSLGCLALLGVACSGTNNRTTVDWRVVKQGDPNAPSPGLAGVKVCVDGHAEVSCVTTDAQGDFSLGFLPDGSEIVLVLEKDGYVPTLKPITTGYTDTTVAQPITMYRAADLPTNLGFAVDAKGAGSIDFLVIVRPQDDAVLAGPLPGAVAALSPAAGESAVYFGTPGVLDPTLKATLSSGGNFALGTASSGRFFNVPPGDYTLTFTPPPKYRCSSFASPADWGFPVPDQPAVRVPVREGYNTANVGVYCVPKK
jgi:hypothetical protein